MSTVLNQVITGLRQGLSKSLGPMGAIAHRASSTGIVVALGVTGTVMALNALGGFQLLEFQAFDGFTRRQPKVDLDERLVVLEVTEADISALQQWPLSDEQLAILLEAVNAEGPRAVGLDIYRDVPVPPGSDRLQAAYAAMPQLVGVEKAVGIAVPPSPILAEQDQVALADLVLDSDNRVRRGLISIQTDSETIKLSLGAHLAMIYLAAEGIHPQISPAQPGKIQLGLATWDALTPRSGPYQHLDSGGYQVLLNYRGGSGGGRQVFPTYSISDLLEGRLPEGALRDRLVLIGATAPSLNDSFLTPYNASFSQRQQTMAGVFIHAHLTRQILTAALEGEGLLRYWSEPAEYGWIGLWAIAAASLSWRLLQADGLRKRIAPGWLVLAGATGLGGTIMAIGYGLFVQGWWVPVAAPLSAVVLMSVALVAYHNQVLERMALVDELTQVANRRQFDRILRRGLMQPQVSLILCDIDYFKQYNDTYGHQAGDDCLTQVARGIRQAVRRSDVVARYGGEEFAVILPQTDADLALEIAERVRSRVEGLEIAHSGSRVSPYVSLSCGVTTVYGSALDSEAAIALADGALYLAKHRGRNRVVQRCQDDDTKDDAQEKAQAKAQENTKVESLELENSKPNAANSQPSDTDTPQAA